MHESYEPIVREDIPAITRVMKRAFDDDSQRHLGVPEGGPPGYDDGSFFEKWLFGQQATHGIKMMVDGRIVGAAIVWVFSNHQNYLGTIFIDPEYQNRGLGSAFWRHIEQTWPETAVWQLETPAFATRNHHFYEKTCGFALAGRHREEGEEHDSLVFRKAMRPEQSEQ